MCDIDYDLLIYQIVILDSSACFSLVSAICHNLLQFFGPEQHLRLLHPALNPFIFVFSEFKLTKREVHEVLRGLHGWIRPFETCACQHGRWRRCRYKRQRLQLTMQLLVPLHSLSTRNAIVQLWSHFAEPRLQGPKLVTWMNMTVVLSLWLFIFIFTLLLPRVNCDVYISAKSARFC